MKVEIARVTNRISFEYYKRTKLKKFCYPLYVNCDSEKMPSSHLKAIDSLCSRYKLKFNISIIFLVDDFHISPGGYTALQSLAAGISAIGGHVTCVTSLVGIDQGEVMANILIASDTDRHLREISSFTKK